VDVGEVAAAPSGDEDLFANAFCVVEQDDVTATVASFNCAHHAGGACSQDDDINLLHSRSPLLKLFSFIITFVSGRFDLAGRWFWRLCDH
jgi:hypothetical protein